MGLPIIKILSNPQLMVPLPYVRHSELHDDTDLDSLSISDLQDDLNITEFQAKKIEKELENRGLKGDSAPLIQLDDKPPTLSPLAKQTSIARVTEEQKREETQEDEKISTVQEAEADIKSQAVQQPEANFASEPKLTGVSTLTQDILKEFIDVSTAIVALENEEVTVQLPIAQNKLQILEKSLLVEQEKFKEFSSKVKVQQEKLKKVEQKWYPGKLIKKGEKRHEKKVKDKKDQVIEAEENVALTMVTIEKLEAELSEQSKLVKELQQKVSRLHAAKQQEKKLVEKLFKVSNKGDKHEQTLDQEFGMLTPKLRAMQEYKSTYTRVNDLLSQALQQIQNAKETLVRSFGLASVDVLDNIKGPLKSNISGGAFVNTAKREGVIQANNVVKNVVELVQQAYNLLPDLPRIDMKHVKELDNAFMDIVFDDVVLDVVMRKKIEQNLKDINKTEKDVEYAYQWTNEWLTTRIIKDYDTVKKQCQDKKSELDTYRHMLIKNTIKEQPLIKI